ncbi:MAG: hypothetical protein CO129_02500 [Ignavibacteriales bacterium CG_4_9_14_3_um_filter_34_10]|nr:MAG: hypothetical protein CO129_02500 [Ignavibacteriales bacterium CG_4_9_14_3_um_filter_34_10]
MKNLILIIFCLFIIQTQLISQFVSVKNGDWRDPLTWSTNPNATAIPDSNSSVTVNHYVIVSSTAYVYSECKDLTINEAGVIDNYSSAWVSGDLTVKNNLTNNGTINPAYDFWLYIGGDFYNNGVITKHYISSKQWLYLMGNIYNTGSFHFSNTTISKFLYKNSSVPHEHIIRSLNDSTIYLGDVSLQDSMGIILIDSLAMLNGKINLNGSRIVLPKNNIYPNELVFDGLTVYDGNIEANGNTIRTKPGTWGYLHYIYNLVNRTKVIDADLIGDFLIGGDGPLTSGGSNLYFVGENRFNGRMADWYSGNIWSMGDRMIIVDGTFENYGQIYDANAPSGKGLYIQQNNNSIFTNYGEIKNKGLYFSGNCNFIPNDTLFVDEFKATDSNTVTTISGNLLFGKSAGTTVDFNGGRLVLATESNFDVPISVLKTLKNIRVEGNNSSVSCVISAEGKAELSNVKIKFIEYLGYNNYTHKMSGNIEILSDGLFAPYWSHYPVVEINGNVKNYGKIENNSSGDLLLYVTRDILHDGVEWTNKETYLTGSTDQNIIMPNDLHIVGKFIFDAMKDGSVYQWQRDGIDIPNQTTKELIFPNGISQANYGTYVCLVDGNPSRNFVVGNINTETLEIFDVAINVLNQNQAQISWKTTIEANGFVFYAENDTTDGFPYEAMEPEQLVKNHELLLDSLHSGSTYYFIIDQMDKDWNNVRSKTYSFVAGAVSVEQENIPIEISLSQNYPNPFNPSTNIKYSIPVKGFVSLKIFDIQGRLIATLVNEQKSAGTYNYEFNSSDYQLSTGIYFYKLQCGDFSKTNKMLLIK